MDLSKANANGKEITHAVVNRFIIISSSVTVLSKSDHKCDPSLGQYVAFLFLATIQDVVANIEA